MEFLKKYPLSILIAIVIWVVCMIPIPETPLSDVSFIDKWTHFVMYGVFTLVIFIERSGGFRRFQKVPGGYLVLLIPIVMGCLVELAQAYLTTCRSGDWLDALCNTLGSLLGLVLYTLFAMMCKRKVKSQLK